MGKVRSQDIPEIVSAVMQFLGVLARCAMACMLAYFGYLAIIELAGNETISDIRLMLSLAFPTTADKANFACVCFGITGFLYGFAQRMLRRRYIERMDKAIKERDKRLDPKKVTSGLNRNGTSKRRSRR